jgi:hypothetical protein
VPYSLKQSPELVMVNLTERSGQISASGREPVIAVDHKAMLLAEVKIVK